MKPQGMKDKRQISETLADVLIGVTLFAVAVAILMGFALLAWLLLKYPAQLLISLGIVTYLSSGRR